MTHTIQQFHLAPWSPIGGPHPDFLANDADQLDIYSKQISDQCSAYLPDGQTIGERKVIRFIPPRDWNYSPSSPYYPELLLRAMDGTYFEAPTSLADPNYVDPGQLVCVNKIIMFGFFSRKPATVFLRWSGHSWFIESASREFVDLPSSGRTYPVITVSI